MNTASLIAEPLAESHLQFLIDLHADQSTMESNGGIRYASDTKKYLTENIQHWETYGFGLWIFRDEETSRPLARGGLRRVNIEGNDEVEVVYTVQYAEWSKGYATEIASLSLDSARKLHLPSVVAIALPSNLRSIRVMTKVGLQFERNVIIKEVEYVLYRHRFY